MNIACTVCSARYVVPDDKIAGRRVRITCKRCKTLLTVDGSVSPPRVTAGGPTSVAPAPTSSAPPSAAAPPAEPVDRRFTVTLADDTQELADVAQIVRLYRSGRLTADTLVWRDGMASWESAWDVPEIADAFRRMGIARPARASSPGQSTYSGASGDEAPTQARGSSASDEEPTHVVPSSPLATGAVPNFGGDFDDDETTRVVESSPFTAQIAEARAREQAAPEPRPEAPTPAAGRPHTPQPFPAQTPAPGERRTSSVPPGSQRARREPKFDKRKAQREAAREAQAAQFAKQSNAGSEMEALEQAIIEQTRQNNPDDDGARLTGARNESSVLFSLDALLQREEREEKPKRKERTDESLLVAPASALPQHVVAAPLTAPDFTAPVLAPPPSSVRPPALEMEIANAPPKRSRLVMPLAMVGVLAAGAAGGYFTGAIKPFGAQPAPSAPTAEPAAVAAANSAPAEAATATASAAPMDSGASPATTEGGASPAPPATGLGEPAAAPDASAAAAAPGAAAAPTPGGKEPNAPSKPASLQDLANAINSSAPPFNTAAAKEALTAASGGAASCAQPGGPTGSGKVSITFAPSGRATSVSVGGAFAGTEVGSCIARKFRGSRVPAFSGEPVSVSKTVTIQ